MKSTGVRTASPGEREAASRRLIVSPHHPDVLRRPSVRGANPSLTQALTWNVFRTFELLPPAFWLRRVNAALGIDLPRPAPVIAQVRLWPQLSVPPTASDPRTPVEPDVLIETEHAVWALVPRDAAIDLRPSEEIVATASALSWYAGRRDGFVGVIVRSSDHALLAAGMLLRYRASPDALQRRMPSRSHSVANIAGLGVATWTQLVDILRDAASSDAPDPVERAIAQRPITWYDELAANAANQDAQWSESSDQRYTPAL